MRSVMTSVHTLHMNTKTRTGIVHHITVGRTYIARGELVTNEAGSAAGKADCGASTSFAAKITEEAVTCPECKGA